MVIYRRLGKLLSTVQILIRETRSTFFAVHIFEKMSTIPTSYGNDVNVYRETFPVRKQFSRHANIRRFRSNDLRGDRRSSREAHDDAAMLGEGHRTLSIVYFIPVTRFSKDYLELGNERFSRLDRLPRPVTGQKVTDLFQ